MEEAFSTCSDYEKLSNAFTGYVRKNCSYDNSSNLMKTRDLFESEIRIQLDKLYKGQAPFSTLTIEQKNNLVTLFGMELDKQYGYGHFVVLSPSKKEPYSRIIPWDVFKEKQYAKCLSKSVR